MKSHKILPCIVKKNKNPVSFVKLVCRNLISPLDDSVHLPNKSKTAPKNNMSMFLCPQVVQAHEQRALKEQSHKKTVCPSNVKRRNKTVEQVVLWLHVYNPAWMFYLHSFGLHLVWQCLGDGHALDKVLGKNTHTHTQGKCSEFSPTGLL